MSGEYDHQDPRLTAAIDLLGRNGARSVQLRYSDDEQPVVWMAVAEFHLDGRGRPTKDDGEQHYEAAGAMHPLSALFKLCGQLMDGGECTHCHRPTGFDEDFGAMPLDELICWYQWDPERATFRRGCEGET